MREIKLNQAEKRELTDSA